MTVCANCHERVHDGQIIIKGRFLCSGGYYVVIYEEDGREKIKKDYS